MVKYIIAIHHMEQIGGIKSDYLIPGFYGQIFNGELSGRKLVISTDETFLQISDFKKPDIRFYAQWWPGNVVNYDIKTIQQDGTHHPEIFAGKMLEFSIEYFEEHGFPVDSIQARWSSKPGKRRNYSEFQEAKKYGLSNEEAALVTWTGIHAFRLGYRNVEVDDQGESVIAVFSIEEK